MNGVELIAAERERQIAEEGWTPEHDDKWDEGQLATAAATYALPAQARAREVTHPGSSLVWSIDDFTWPWDDDWLKLTPDDRIRELVKAGALIVAEIDRLNRLAVAA